MTESCRCLRHRTGAFLNMSIFSLWLKFWFSYWLGITFKEQLFEETSTSLSAVRNFLLQYLFSLHRVAEVAEGFLKLIQADVSGKVMVVTRQYTGFLDLPTTIEGLIEKYTWCAICWKNQNHLYFSNIGFASWGFRASKYHGLNFEYITIIMYHIIVCHAGMATCLSVCFSLHISDYHKHTC